MDLLRGLAAHLRSLLWVRAADRDLDDEIRFHLDRETEKNVRLGLAPTEARRRTVADFGGVRQVKERHRDVRGVTVVEEFLGDARFALRALRRAPALTTTAVVTLALGIGANVAIFSAVNGVILRPLPFADPDRLVALGENNAEKNWHMETASPANLLDWRARVPAFSDVAAFVSPTRATLTGRGAPQRLTTVAVTGNFFSLLGIRPALGRDFTFEESWRSDTKIVMLSDRIWRYSFGADPAVVGRVIEVNGSSVRVVGVMPAEFAFPEGDVDLWMPVEWNPESRSDVRFRRAHYIRPIARLAPGVAPGQADAQFQQIVTRMKQEYPETNRVMGAGMVPLRDFLVGTTRLPLLILLCAVALLLLIACANVGNLLLVQTAGRERELSLRVALGAGRLRIVRQALTESLVLSAIGGATGLAVGWAGTRVLASLQPERLLRVDDVALDWRVFAYVAALTTVSGLLFGAAPAFAGARRMPADAIRGGGRSGSQGRRMTWWSDALVVGEVALALILTVGAGLLVRSFWALQHIDPGFGSAGVLTVAIDLPGSTYDTSQKTQTFFDDLLTHVGALPGVTDVAITDSLPLTGNSWTSDFTIASRPEGEYGTEVMHRSISPGYLRAMRVRLLAGRAFTDADPEQGPPVVIINEALARQHFRNENPIGQQISGDRVPSPRTRWLTIVGVVGSEQMTSLALDPQIQMIEPMTQQPTNSATLVARTTGDPTALAPSIRRAVSAMDDKLALGTIRPMSAVHAESLSRERFFTTLLFVFAGIGLVLSVVGVYGVIAQHARRRTREMGIRIALGAQATAVRWIIVRQGLELTAVGLTVGGLSALVATRAMQGMLFQTPSNDPVTFAVVAALLGATGVLASWIPARKASRADPVRTLREE